MKMRLSDSFIRGYANTFNILGGLYPQMRNTFFEDRMKIYSDWKRVGRDISYASAKYGEEQASKR